MQNLRVEFKPDSKVSGKTMAIGEKRINLIKIFLFFGVSLLLIGNTFASVIVEPDDGQEPLIKGINKAKTSIDVSIYEIMDSSGNGAEQILNALTNAVIRGVKVRMILNDFDRSSFPEDGHKIYANEIRWCKKNAINERPSSSAFRYTHNKYILIDNKTAYIMTGNLTGEDFLPTGHARNFIIVDNNSCNVSSLSELFEDDFRNAKTDDDVTPTDIPKDLIITSDFLRNLTVYEISNFINSTKKKLDIYMMYFGKTCPKEITTAITDVAKRGVKVRIICSTFQNEDVIKAMERSSKNIKARIIDEDVQGIFIHTKVFIRDSSAALLGSINMSNTSIGQNRELDIITYKKTEVDRIEKTFNSDWKIANPNLDTLDSHKRHQYIPHYRKTQRLYR